MERGRQPRRKLNFKNALALLKHTFSEWSADKAPRLGAALSYYTVFSIAPLILIAITIAGLVFANAQIQVVTQIKGLVGDQGAEAIQSMIKAAQKPVQSTVASILAFATLFFGAAGVFIQLKDALNTIWNVKETSAGGVWKFIRKYFLSFGMVLGIGFLLLVSLLLEAGVAIAGEVLQNRFPGIDVIMQLAGVIVSFGVITVLFAMLFKFLPDVKVTWHDVWIGAVLTSIMFVVGKVGLGVYLGKAGVASAYGAAGSLVVILLWVYYSSQILFFGAEFTQVYSKYHGSRSELAEFQPQPQTYKEKLVKQIERERKELATAGKTFGFIPPKPRTFKRFERDL